MHKKSLETTGQYTSLSVRRPATCVHAAVFTKEQIMVEPRDHLER